MKTLLTSFTAATLAITSFAAFAQTPEILVQPERVSPNVVAEVSADLDRTLDRTLKFYDYSSANGGIVQVTFATDENGEPVNADFYRKSGSASLDRIAMRSVRKLEPINGQRGRNQRFLANIIVATSNVEMRELEAELAQSERARIASKTPAATYVAIGFIANSPGG
ncbi:energy transducer TonB [Qipengyuania sp. CAU 1752]